MRKTFNATVAVVVAAAAAAAADVVSRTFNFSTKKSKEQMFNVQLVFFSLQRLENTLKLEKTV